MRSFLIAGNWKMNKGPSETRSMLEALKKEVSEVPESLDLLVCPPFVSLIPAAEVLGPLDRAYLGAQDLHYEEEGAYTGEISADMIRETGCDFVIVGHSERREYFGETDVVVNQKVKKALEKELKPVICVGESLEQRKAGEHRQLVRKQVQAALNDVKPEHAVHVVIAYEPIWAIGTGETATPEQAQQMQEMIRSEFEELYGSELAEALRILYGGSMKPHNAGELLSQPDVDGGLIGGASLQAESFAEIIRTADDLSN